MLHLFEKKIHIDIEYILVCFTADHVKVRHHNSNIHFYFTLL